jgi:hypothetical protein
MSQDNGWLPFPAKRSLTPFDATHNSAPDLPGCGIELALLRRLKLIAQQFTTKRAPIVPCGQCVAERN